MRRLTLHAGSAPGLLFEAFSGTEPLDVELAAAPDGVCSLDLLLALAAFERPFVVRFAGRLATPLVEAACLALAADWADGASLDLRGCFFAPLLRRADAAALARLLARAAPLDPGELLTRAGRLEERSPDALALLAPLLTRRFRSTRGAYAAERAAFGLVMAAGGRREGIAAFRERRPPKFGW